MNKLLFFLAFLGMITQSSSGVEAKEGILFATDQNPFQGYYDKGQFHPLQNLAELKTRFVKQGGTFTGFDSSGRKISGKLKRFIDSSGGGYEPLLEFSFLHGKPKNPYFLASDGQIRFLSVKATSRISDDLRKKVESVMQASFAKAKNTHEGNEVPELAKLNVGQEWDFPIVKRKIIFYTLTVKSSEGVDNRGTFFALIDSTSGSIILSSFGHPEWGPNSDIMEIRPEIYFSLANSRKIYFLGTHRCGWECSQNAIYDLETGKAELLSL